MGLVLHAHRHCSFRGIVWAGETHWHYEKLLKENEGAKELLAQKAMYMNVATILQACCVWVAIFSLIGLTENT